MYHEIIPKKQARDLRTIRTKLDQDRYDTIDAVKADVELLVNNAVAFNGEASEVGQLALTLLGRFRDGLASMTALHGSNSSGVQKKRQADASGSDSHRGTPAPMTKKVKLK
jgi:transcription initiation factor TFIID subunit 2